VQHGLTRDQSLISAGTPLVGGGLLGSATGFATKKDYEVSIHRPGPVKGLERVREEMTSKLV
jgi:hypothetical protein